MTEVVPPEGIGDFLPSMAPPPSIDVALDDTATLTATPEAEASAFGTLARGSTWMLAAAAVWHASNFAYNSIAARHLGPSRYGGFVAVTSLVYIATPLFSAVQSVVTRLVTGLVAESRQNEVPSLLRSSTRRLGVAGVGLALCALLLAPWLARFARLPSAVPLMIVAALVPLSAMTHAQRGVLLGLLRYDRQAISTATEALAKITLLIVLFVVLRPSESVAVSSIVGSIALCLVVNKVLLRFLPKASARWSSVARTGRGSLAAVCTYGLLATMFALDTLAAKHYLDPRTAGVYAAVSLVGGIVFFASVSVSGLLFSQFSLAEHKGRDARTLLLVGLLVTGLFSALQITVYALAPTLVLRPLFGRAYDAAHEFLPAIGLVFAFYAVLYICSTFLLAHHRAIGIVMLAAGLAAQITGFYLFHGSMGQIIEVDLWVFIVAGTVTLVIAAK